MKKFNKILISTFFLSGVFSLPLFGQEVCMVTADFDDAKKYIVIWEKPAVITGIDSVFIYRKQGTETGFTRVGARSMQDDFSFFLDPNSSTIVNHWYRIAYLYDSGIESAPSPWHHPVVVDYLDGLIAWNLYEKEGQVDETWVSGYECIRDETGLGMYTSMGYWSTASGATQTDWFDQEAPSNQGFEYQLVVDLPACDITKANINTSRSNIKSQMSNEDEEAQSGINHAGMKVNFALSPNPAQDIIRIELDEKLIGADFVISSLSGQILNRGQLGLNNQEINIDQLEAGGYFFTIRYEGMNFSRTFIKK